MSEWKPDWINISIWSAIIIGCVAIWLKIGSAAIRWVF